MSMRLQQYLDKRPMQFIASYGDIPRRMSSSYSRHRVMELHVKHRTGGSIVDGLDCPLSLTTFASSKIDLLVR